MGDASFADQPHDAVDMGSNRLYPDCGQVWLIPFSLPCADYLIDPLALTDLTPPWPPFEDLAVVKALHVAEYGLLCLRRGYGVCLVDRFRTRVAKQRLGPTSGLRAAQLPRGPPGDPRPCTRSIRVKGTVQDATAIEC